MPVCVFIIATFIIFIPITGPSLLLVSDDKVIYEKIITSPICQISFRHSVNKGHIKEVYRLDKGRQLLTLETGYFQSYGAGMIDTVEESTKLNFRQEGEYYLLDFDEDWKKTINYIGGNIAKHVFSYKDDVIDIGEKYPRTPFYLTISRRSIFKIVLKLP